MEVAEQLVAVERQIDVHETALEELKDRAKKLKARVQQFMEEGQFPISSNVSGANVHLQAQIWAGPATDHSDLAAALSDEGLFKLLPGTVHSGRLSSYVREHDTKDPTQTIEERFSSLPDSLKSAIKITEKFQIKVTGA